MNILIIGGAGYIGGVTTHLLQQQGHTLTVFDNLSTGHEYNLPKGTTFIRGDICNRDDVAKVFNGTTYHAVMHFAAKILVPESMHQPYDYFTVNTTGALNCIDAAVRAGVGYYIFSSTAAVYGEPPHVPLTEADPTLPVNPYGASKLLTEQLLRSYHITHGLKWAALRYFNVAGSYAGVGTDYPFVSHIVPMLLERMADKQPIKVFGNDYDTPDGTCVRDYVHVADIAGAHVKALATMAGGGQLNQPLNLASQQGYSVKQVIDTFNNVTKAGLTIEYAPRRAGDPARLFASGERAKKLIGWQPRYDLRRMITDHYQWYQNKRAGATMLPR